MTSPKTQKRNCTIKMLPFLCEEMQEYIHMLYDIKPGERLFSVTKSYLSHEMERGAKQVGVQGNPRVYKALKNQIAANYEDLKRLEALSLNNDELLYTLQVIAITLDGLKGEDE